MRFIHSWPVHRSFAFLLGILFATVTTTPIKAQSRVRTVAQVPATESTTTGDKEPRQAFAGQLAIFVGHEDRVTSATFSPDGSKILTASEDETARLWDLNGNLLTVFRGHEDSVKSVIFSPDGRQILTTSNNYTARLWDIKGNLIKEFREADDPSHATSSTVQSAVFSPDGKQILTVIAFSDKAGIWDKFRLWDTKGNLLVEFQRDKAVRYGTPSLLTAVFSPDGRQILTVGSDQTARLWDIKGNLLKEFEGYKIIRAVFSPDSRQILTVSNDETVRLWNTEGNLLTEFQRYEEESVYSAEFSPDGRQILTDGSDKAARLWDLKGNLLLEFQGHESYEWSVRGFSPDGRQILTTARDGTVQIWDTKGNRLATLRGHNDLIQAVFSPDGRQILTFGWDKVARLWDVSAAIAAESEQIAARETLEESVSKNNAQLAIFQGDAYRAVFSPDGRQILTYSQNNVRLWDLKGNLLAEFQEREARAIFSPDGRQILTIGAGGLKEGRWAGTTRLWDTQGNLLAELRGSESLPIHSATFSPDGRQILTAGTNGGGDDTARLWDLKGNLLAELRPPETVWGGVAQSAVFSPDGKQILTASNDKTARLWDLKGNLLVEFRGHEKAVNSAVFSPDGKQILTASSDETARLWDTKGNLLTEFRGHRGRIKRAEFSPDGKQILTDTLDDETARLWDTKGNLLTEYQVEEKYLSRVVFSPDGRQILTTSNDAANGLDRGIARLWDTKGNLLAVFRGHELGINSEVFSPDGRQILTAGADGTVRLWDVSIAMAAQAEQTAALQSYQENLSKNNAQLAALRDEKDEIRRAVFSPDGRQILTITDKTVRLWDAQGNLVAHLPGQEYVESAEFSPDSRQILVATDSRVCLWDTKGNLLVVFQEKWHRIQSAVFSPDARQVLTASLDSTARLWDLKGNVITVFRGHEYDVNSAVFSPNGRQILTSSLDKTARLWDTQGNLLQEFRGHEWVDNAIFSPDGRQILTLGNDFHGYARLWDTKGNLLAEFRGQKDVYQGSSHDSFVEFSPDGTQILITSSDRLARLWELKGNLLAVFRDHGSVNSAVFSPDGRQILTASEDQTARLWDNQGNLLAIFRGHEDSVESAVFSPDGKQILTASRDRTARIWDISTGIKVSAAEVSYIKGNQLSNQETIESRQLALQNLEEALTLYRAEQNIAQAALTLLSIGNIYADLGQFQNALDSYNQALPLSQKAGATAVEADILNRLGQLYNELADSKTALTYLNQALPLYYQLNDQGAVAATLNNIGEIQATFQDWENALKSYNQALTISRPAGTLDAEASALMGIGKVYIASENWSTALNAYHQALLICRHLNDKIKETIILNQIGKIQTSFGQISEATASYNQALTLSQQLGYKTEEANILYNQAILSRQQNNLTTAKTEIETAINIIENLRTQIASQELRQSYFARNQDYYQFYIDLLMQLHQQDPNKGYDAEALHISERARARSILELLTEATAEIRSGVDPNLLEKEQNLQQQLNALDHEKYQLVSGSYSDTELEEIKQKIESTLAQLDQIKAQIRVSSPRYADLKYPEPLTVQEIQQQVLDEETVLLEYALGEEQSYLWVVTQNSLNSYILPKESEIEPAAKTYRDIVTLDSTAKIDIGLPLSKILLDPVISQLENKRLLIVGDGILQTIPFAALPLPTSPSTPLLAQNEIVTLPSASTVSIQRRQLENRPLATKTLAVLADPVFNLNDERVAGTPSQRTASINNFALTRAARNLGIGETPILDRLKYTRIEAEKILALVPESQRLQAFDFQASHEIATDPNLAQFQILHLATHGLLDPVNPELSGVVLSLFDSQGQPQDGFLRLNDIFNLNLPAELVVLSACQTGLGEEVRGEGLVGLTRGFMYAGARRVVVSLWSVSDSATSELMSEFYQKMLNEKQEPVSALREAQLEMWNAGNSPYYWAAFTVQGDWR